MPNNLSLLSQLGKRIAYLRRQKGLSQLDLATEADLAHGYLSDLERGKRNPSAKTLAKIAFALDVTLEELFKGIIPID